MCHPRGLQSLPLWFASLILLSHPALAQIAGDPQPAERRIRELENRLAVVEAQLEQLLRERNGANPPAAQSEGQSEAQSEGRSEGRSEGMLQPAPIAPATPAPSPRRFETPPDLIPEVGKIGAEVGVLATASANPFHLNRGAFYGAYIDLPLLDTPAWLHGKLAYEINIGLSRSQSTITSTSNVAQVTNLAILTALSPATSLQNLADAVTGTGAAPFPVTAANRLNLRLLQVVPFSFKYTSTILDKWRLRPYALLGFGVYVAIHNENPASPNFGVRTDANLPPDILQAVVKQFGGASPFGSPLVAGQIGQSPELVARGLPGGNGNIDIGLHTGGGLEFRLTRTLSLGVDARFNKISGSHGDFSTYGSRIGFHF